MKKTTLASKPFILAWGTVFLFYLLTLPGYAVAADYSEKINDVEQRLRDAYKSDDLDKLRKEMGELEKLEDSLMEDTSISKEEKEALEERIDGLIEEAGQKAPIEAVKHSTHHVKRKIIKHSEACKADKIKKYREKLEGYKSRIEAAGRVLPVSQTDVDEFRRYIDELISWAKKLEEECLNKRQALLTTPLKDFVLAAAGTEYVEENSCRDKQEAPNDPYFHLKGSWGQAYDDQWAIKHVGFTADKTSAWNIEDGAKNPVVVAAIDTGLDWNHQDISWDNIWRNEDEIPDNGKDDDNNGYVDDTIGWNFMGNNNKPWDEDGHGTFITGVIAAATNNGVGIAGINRGAKIMILKALNTFGHTRASFLSEAIFYAANNGARVINISAGGKRLTKTEQEAIDYAHDRGAVIVVASGNEAVDTLDYSPAGLRNVIAVASTDEKDKRAGFSNWGQGIDLAAPGMDVLSLRARRTDLMLGIPGIKYTPRLAYVGKDTRYYRASGSSFSAPIVTATASLILAKNPKLTNTQVERMLLQSARDIEVPGWDQYTGFGLLDAVAALKADPEYYLLAQIQKVQPVQEKGAVYLEVLGTAEGSHFKEAAIDIGLGERPEKWEGVVKINQPLREGRLGLIPATKFNKVGKWSVRLLASDKKGKLRESRASVDIE